MLIIYVENFYMHLVSSMLHCHQNFMSQGVEGEISIQQTGSWGCSLPVTASQSERTPLNNVVREAEQVEEQEQKFGEALAKIN